MDFPLPVWQQQYGWTECTSNDYEILEAQLGRRPRTVLAVARRCRYGAPQVIVNDPLPAGEHELPRPFPTLFWLSCPYLVRTVGQLEAKGGVASLREQLVRGDLGDMSWAHLDYAALRLEMCDETKADQLRSRAPKQYEILATAGVGGIGADDGVKCLHTHLADYLGRQHRAQERSAINWIGQKTTELLLQEGVDLDGSPTCEGCPARRVGKTSAETSAEMSAEREHVAALEIGSHAVRMIVSPFEADERASGGPWPVAVQQRVATRLVEGVGQDGTLNSAAMEKTIQVVSELADVCRSYDAVWVAGATAAVRRASNGGVFLRQLWERTGVSAPVLSESDEAHLTFLGASLGSFQPRQDQSLGVIDVGGGSTEIALGKSDGALIDSESLPIGAVVASERFVTSDPSAKKELADLRAEMSGCLRAAPLVGHIQDRSSDSVVFMAVGGTASSALAMKLAIPEGDLDAVDDPYLSLSDVSDLVEKLAAMPAAERAQVAGLAVERVDAIVGGLIILYSVMQQLGASSVVVSRSDILQGLLWRNFPG